MFAPSKVKCGSVDGRVAARPHERGSVKPRIRVLPAERRVFPGKADDLLPGHATESKNEPIEFGAWHSGLILPKLGHYSLSAGKVVVWL